MLTSRPFRTALRTSAAGLMATASSLSFANAADAATPTEIVEAWFQSYLELGADSATYERLESGSAAGDITVHGATIAFTLDFEDSGGDGPFDVEISFDEASFSGLQETDEGYRAQAVEIPGALRVSFTEATAPKPKKTAEGEDTVVAPLPPVSARISYENIALNGIAWPHLPKITHDPERPVTGYLKHLGFLTGVRIDTGEIAFARAEVNAPVDDVQSSAVYEDMSIIGLANGRMEEQYLGHFETTEVMPAGSDTTKDDPVSFSGGPVIVRGFDINPVLALLGQPTARPGLKILDSEEILDIRVSGPDFEFAMDGLLFEDIAATTSEPLTLLGLLDREAKGDNVSDDEGAMAAFEAGGAFSMGRLELTGLAAAGEEGEGSLRRFLIKNISGQGLGEISVDDIAVDIRDEGAFELGRFSIADVRFPPASAIMTLDDVDDPTVQQVLDATPTISRFLVSALSVSGKELPGNVELDHFSTRQSGYINKIATDIAVMLRGLDIPVALIDDRQAQQMLAGLGLQRISLDQNLRLHWNEATGDLVLEDLSLHMDNGGTAQLSLTFGSIPRSLFEQPDAAQAVLAVATFKSASLKIADAEIVQGFLAAQARESGLSADTLAFGLADQLKSQMGPLAPTAFGSQLYEAAKTFLGDPKEFTVDFAPKAPVPLTQILGMAATAPAAIPELLGARVAAK